MLPQRLVSEFCSVRRIKLNTLHRYLRLNVQTGLKGRIGTNQSQNTF